MRNKTHPAPPIFGNLAHLRKPGRQPLALPQSGKWLRQSGSLVLALAMFSAIPAAATPVGSASPAGAAAPAASSGQYDRWEKEISAFETADREHAPPSNSILFAGSSSIRMWDLARWFPDLTLINRGFGGSQIDDSTHFAPRIILPYHPRLIVFYAGDNDIDAGKSPERVLSDFKAFTQVVHRALPRTRILFLSIKPSLARKREMETQRQANHLVEAYCKTHRRLRYVDVASLLLDRAGKPRPDLFREDGLHLNDAGYALWTARIRPLLK